jgi:uncharacterized protein
MTNDPLALAGRFRLVIWQVMETAGFESAWLLVDGWRVRAVGQATGQRPVPYWLSYILETDSRAVTASLEVTATMLGWEQHLDLRRDRQGWTADGERRPDLADALDCDLAWSPVTVTMPVIRHGLHRYPGVRQSTVASVEVPSLQVSPVQEAYTYLGPAGSGARVRRSRGSSSADLLLDSDGLVIDYPAQARRVAVTGHVTLQRTLEWSRPRRRGRRGRA